MVVWLFTHNPTNLLVPYRICSKIPVELINAYLTKLLRILYADVEVKAIHNYSLM